MDQAGRTERMATSIGTSSLYLRGETWWGRCKIAGHEYRSTLRTGDRREAARRYKAWRTKLERQAVGEPDAPTFKQAAVKWALEVLPKAVKPAVAARYLVSIRQLEPVFGDLRMDEITAPKIGEYISRRSQVATNATIRRDLTALSRMLAACVSWGWRQDNPARWYDRSIIRERRDPIEAPRARDVETLLEVCPPGMAAILRLLEQTGMREAEAVTLEAWQVNWVARTITLSRTKTNRPRTLKFKTPGGDAGPILDGIAIKGGALFPSSTGDGYSVGSFSSGVGRIMREVIERERLAGRPFQRFRVHDLRHGFAIRALREGMNIYELSRHLGHTSVKTTEIYLDHLTGDEAQAARSGGTKSGTVEFEVGSKAAIFDGASD
jgi:integrase/recombinase XerD